MADGTANVNQTTPNGEMEPFDTPMPSNKTLNETKENQREEAGEGHSRRGSPKMKTEKSKPIKQVAGKGYRDTGNDVLGREYGLPLQLLPLAEEGEHGMNWYFLSPEEPLREVDVVFDVGVEFVRAGWMRRSDGWLVLLGGRFVPVWGGGTAGGVYSMWYFLLLGV